jgi:rSAM/selenodomain-associated transferase 1
VKTRLAADVGDAEAVRIYRHLGRRVVDAVRGGAYHLRVCFTPADAARELQAWLGDHEMELRPQADGDLGRKMDQAFREAFEDGADAVCLVGTDAPGVDRALVERAFRALEEHDVVIGPTEDGGYYLLGLNGPRPELFRDIPWSTDRVLALTRERILRAGLDLHLLPVLPDVDTLADLPLELRT